MTQQATQTPWWEKLMAPWEPIWRKPMVRLQCTSDTGFIRDPWRFTVTVKPDAVVCAVTYQTGGYVPYSPFPTPIGERLKVLEESEPYSDDAPDSMDQALNRATIRAVEKAEAWLRERHAAPEPADEYEAERRKYSDMLK